MYRLNMYNASGNDNERMKIAVTVKVVSLTHEFIILICLFAYFSFV